MTSVEDKKKEILQTVRRIIPDPRERLHVLKILAKELDMFMREKNT